jgi:hypothetical protein
MALEGGSHFYRADGSPVHVIPKKDGTGMRPTTIRDARSLGLFASSTTILKQLAKPQLEKWTGRQIAMAALKYERKPDEVIDDDLADKIRELAFKQVEDAADLGTNVHKALENYFSEEPYDMQYDIYVQAVANLFAMEGVHVMQRELTIVNTREGYAGRTDLLIDSPKGTGVGDYKVRKTKPGKEATPFDGQATQIASYVAGHYGDIDGHVGFNVFVSSTEPGRVEIAWYDTEELKREWEIFKALCTIYRVRNNHDPRIL